VNIAFLGAERILRTRWPAPSRPLRLVILLQDELPARPDVREGQRAGHQHWRDRRTLIPVPRLTGTLYESNPVSRP